MEPRALASLFGGDEERNIPIIASIFTPYQLLFLERIMAFLPPRPLLIIDARTPLYRSARAPHIADAQVREFDLTGRVNDPDQAQMVRDALAVADGFAGDQAVCFISASYQWPLNNVIYHAHRRDRQWRFFLQDDGVSTYLDLRPSPRERFRNLVREAVSRMRGFPHRSFIPGHPLGHDIAELSAIILGLEPGAWARGHDRVIVLPTQQQSFSGTGAGALVIGQPLLKYGLERLTPFVHKIAATLKRRGYDRLHFKPHHYQSEEEIKLFCESGFDLYNPPLPVEEILADSEFRLIASVSSTALLTSKALFGDQVHAIAFNPCEFPPAHEKRDPAETEKLFRRAGVEIINV